ncbi:keratin, type I cytoskeletal 19-like [Rhinoraja longicauda]
MNFGQQRSVVSKGWSTQSYTGGSQRMKSSNTGTGTSGYVRSGGMGLGGMRSKMSFGMSSNIGMGSGMSLGGGMGMGGGIVNNEKQTMQDLNDRLAHYLNMVGALEKSNMELEVEISAYCDKHGPAQRDDSAYWATIRGLREQIINMILDNSGVMLQVDNSKLAAEDFRTKYENELGIRMSVDNDINGLRTMLDNMTMDKSQLEMDIENLREEIIYIRKNHEDELKGLRTQMSGNVSVAVTSDSGVDLLQIMDEMRGKYEAAAKKNKDDLDNWYKEQCVSVELQVAVNTGALDAEKGQLSELRRTLQGLETEFQTYLSMIASLEQSLSETDCRYSTERSKLEMMLQTLEMELSEARGKIHAQNDEYTMLLNIKCRLETEIETYRRLLGGYGQTTTVQKTRSTVSTVVKENIPDPVVSKKTVMYEVVEVMVDGQVVSTETQQVRN